jgi:hypothetical protein
MIMKEPAFMFVVKSFAPCAKRSHP